ncbi:Phosphoglucose isomerase (PGI) [Prochlorococcus marinus str. MIT 9515]|uniref:Glucose-6-phosphate isomerase n=1 Tax=Prochlorococcus marinus (strain MIT 9515) TaxID=167542 RepID=G6PI_PROM5|nr:glucose-6-phosphate isomerase [Prochlorococcus marinus]A2BWL8.1 RecName: Full=Glucose-6-phosphate isomerase; Short=GPI; AltName: Full=Phosphoglucose isomerase; Short=PGI; AltName: Full=Phosphohexose isomerase; Short=PHI [Prochlorococcus marinus str. MIT 9515]ABM72179.1 Phosphoglucose isomerase (PGI) [Prochlorococcus marinus str. MIT 9515]
MNNDFNSWDKYCDYLWYDQKINIWLDISKINFSYDQISSLENKFIGVFSSIKELEAGAISNIDEKRQVGHYWLRNPSIAPNTFIKDEIIKDIRDISEFGDKVLKGIIKNNKNQTYTDVLWIGIGGSGLGPLLITEALQENSVGLNFSYIDNIDPFLISEKLDELSDKLPTTLFVVVSKSGGTPEPKIAMNIIKRHVEDKNILWNSNAIAITMKNSQLYKKAKLENWLKIFNLPDWVGGRTSITSSVGLLPLALINQDVSEFIRGASIMDELTRITNIKDNPAALLSSAWFFSGNGIGKRDMVVLPYRDRLQVFSKYLQQLVMESLGKKFNRKGKIVHQGISVFGNKGSTDQHAYVQQLRDGIDNFFCVFIELLDIPDDNKYFGSENPKEFLSGFLQGTRSALSNENRQSITITLDKLNCLTLGALIALFERAVSFYAELVDINAYDQPGVEAGKKAAAEILEYQKKVTELLNNGEEFSIKKITSLIENSTSEPIFFIIRQMCFGNDDYLIKGDWSNPISIIIKKNSK